MNIYAFCIVLNLVRIHIVSVRVYSYNELHSPYYYTRDEYEYNKSYKIKYTIYDKYKEGIL